MTKIERETEWAKNVSVDDLIEDAILAQNVVKHLPPESGLYQEHVKRLEAIKRVIRKLTENKPQNEQD